MYERSTGAPEPKLKSPAGFRNGFDPFAPSGSYFEPNHYSASARLWNSFLALALVTYGGLGVFRDDLFIPGKRSSGVHLHGWAAWLMFAAFLCAAAVMFALVVDHYDRRNNEHHYIAFKKLAVLVGWLFFCAAFAWQIVGLFLR